LSSPASGRQPSAISPKRRSGACAGSSRNRCEVGRGVEGLLLGLGYLLGSFVFVLIAFAMSWELTLATLVFGVVTIVLYREAMARSQRRSASLSEGLGDLTHFVTDLLGNFKFYKASGASERVLDRARRVFGRWRDDFVRVERYVPATRSGFDVAGLMFIATILGVAVLIAGASPVKSFVFLALFYRLAPKLQQAQQRLLLAGSQIAWWKTWQERYQGALATGRRARFGSNRGRSCARRRSPTHTRTTNRRFATCRGS